MTKPEIPRLTADHSDKELTTALEVWGCCVVEGAAAPEVMDEVATDLEPHAHHSEYGDSDFAGAGTRRTGLVLNRSPTYRRIAMHPSVMTAGNHVLADAPSWNLSSVGFFELFPGEPKQLLHRDIWKYGVQGIPTEVDLNGLWAITDLAGRTSSQSQRERARPDVEGLSPALRRQNIPRRRA